MRWRDFCAAGALLSTAFFARAEPVAETSRGAAIYVICGSCHGSAAQGERNLMAPSLAGQRRKYILRQLGNFRDGVRPSRADGVASQMPQILQTVADEADWEAVAWFLEQIPPSSRAAAVAPDSDVGRRKYALCASCHGAEGQGNDDLGSPRLNILPEWYITEQLQKFKDGRRGANPGDPLGKGMRAIARTLTPVDIEVLARYIPQLTATTGN